VFCTWHASCIVDVASTAFSSKGEIDGQREARNRSRSAKETPEQEPAARRKSIAGAATPGQRQRLREEQSGVAAADEDSLLPFVLESIEPGSTIHTDGSAAYRSLPDHGYVRDKTVILGSADPAHVSLPAVHRVAALLKRWLLGTHHGSVQHHQLDAYLDEFTFRFNRRSSRSRGLLFYRLLEQVVATTPVTYRTLVDKHNL
jgi:transposase-like protein